MKTMREELSELLELAKHAASLAAAVHRRAIGEAGLDVNRKSSTSDLVTEVDREAERQLVTAIRAARPLDWDRRRRRDKP